MSKSAQQFFDAFTEEERNALALKQVGLLVSQGHDVSMDFMGKKYVFQPVVPPMPSSAQQIGHAFCKAKEKLLARICSNSETSMDVANYARAYRDLCRTEGL